MMNAGYAVWREAVADIMADSILSEYTSLTLADVREEGDRQLLLSEKINCFHPILGMKKADKDV